METIPNDILCVEFERKLSVSQSDLLYKGASKMQKAELQKPFEWTWNILDYFQSQIDLWPPKNRQGTSSTHKEQVYEVSWS